MSRPNLKAAVLLALSATACSAPDGVANDTPEPAATQAPAQKRELPKTSANPSVQALVAIAVEDLVERVDTIDTADIRTLRSEQVMWSSGAMGCPLPDRGYTMALVPGVLIQLRAKGEVYEYHSTLRGPPFLCEPPGRIEKPTPRTPTNDPT